jgi:hypothetical protein
MHSISLGKSKQEQITPSSAKPLGLSRFPQEGGSAGAGPTQSESGFWRRWGGGGSFPLTIASTVMWVSELVTFVAENSSFAKRIAICPSMLNLALRDLELLEIVFQSGSPCWAATWKTFP